MTEVNLPPVSYSGVFEAQGAGDVVTFENLVALIKDKIGDDEFSDDITVKLPRGSFRLHYKLELTFEPQ